MVLYSREFFCAPKGAGLRMSVLSYNDSINSWKTEADEPCSESRPI
jgi:hypothetical protein